MAVYLVAPRYVLGEIEQGHGSIAKLVERAREFGMPVKPELWGWGSVRRTERGLEAMAVDTGLATLHSAGVTASDVDALVLCSTKFPGGAEAHGRFVEVIMKAIGLDAAFFGLTLNRCTNFLSGLSVAEALVRAGRYRRVLVVTTDRVDDEGTRMESFALFSDGAASCLVGVEPGADGYELLGAATAQDIGALDCGNEISSDLAREVNDSLLRPHGLSLTDVAGLMHNNLFTPIVVMKERQAGFTAAQLHTANTVRVGHCFAADPLINLVDRAADGQVHGGRHYVLASSVPGSRVGILLRRLVTT